jgi:hypothetical protein
MRTQTTLTAADLLNIERTETQPTYGHIPERRLQHITAYAQRAAGELTMYLTADEARDIALHFRKLADGIDAETAALDMEAVAS